MYIREVDDDEDILKLHRRNNPSTQTVLDREDKETIQKIIQSMSEITPPPSSYGSLEADRVRPSLKTAVDTISPADRKSMENVIKSDFKPNPNYVNELQNLIAKILVQLNEISQTDKKQTSELKKKYKNYTKQAAGIEKTLGSNGFKFSAIAFGITVGSYFVGSKNDQEILQHFSKQFFPGIQSMYDSGYKGDLQTANALAQLLLQEIQNKANESQGNTKEQFNQLYKELLQIFVSAARGG